MKSVKNWLLSLLLILTVSCASQPKIDGYIFGEGILVSNGGLADVPFAEAKKENYSCYKLAEITAFKDWAKRSLIHY